MFNCHYVCWITKNNFIMNLKRLLLKPTGVLCFLIALFSCEDNLTSDIEDVEESVYTNGSEISELKNIDDVERQADEAFLRSIRKHKVASASSIPHWVGVLAADGYCPTGVGVIKYFMDCEDKNENTAYEIPSTCSNCYKSKGAVIDKNGNVTWTICIVDANKYSFKRIAHSYAIFDLSSEQYLGANVPTLFVQSDDEDNDNKNQFYNTNYGFVRNDLGAYPTQESTKNTKFWLLYFEADKSSKGKLPNLGFNYDVFSGYGCDYSNKAILRVDTEDKNNINFIKYYKVPDGKGNDSPYVIKGKWVDNTYYIIKNQNDNMYYAIQKYSALNK